MRPSFSLSLPGTTWHCPDIQGIAGRRLGWRGSAKAIDVAQRTLDEASRPGTSCRSPLTCVCLGMRRRHINADMTFDAVLHSSLRLGQAHSSSVLGVQCLNRCRGPRFRHCSMQAVNLALQLHKTFLNALALAPR
ncbi:unnamed protein product, partial [Mycena citricolor]